jgi:hypothetical protein
VSDNGVRVFQVKGEAPLETGPALFSNFLAVSRVGTEVQFEFIFLDLNQVAAMLTNPGEVNVPLTLVGKTVTKIVMPAAAFVQVKEQLDKIFEAFKEIVPKSQEVENERRSSTG